MIMRHTLHMWLKALPLILSLFLQLTFAASNPTGLECTLPLLLPNLKTIKVLGNEVKASMPAVTEKASEAYLASLDTVRQQGIEKLIDSKTVDTVFYPFSGSDGGGVARLFPAATTLVGLSEESFFEQMPTPSRPLDFSYVIKNQSGFRWLGELQKEPNIASSLLGSLHSAIEGFRLNEVIIFETLEHFNMQGINHPLSSTHGIIVFDQGPGTPVRRYLHIQANISARVYPGTSWWMNLLEKNPPQGILVKAAMSSFTTHMRNSDFYDATLDWLHQTNGILVEGQSKQRLSHWEFSQNETLPYTSATSILDGLEFGYTGSAKITSFSKKER